MKQYRISTFDATTKEHTVIARFDDEGDVIKKCDQMKNDTELGPDLRVAIHKMYAHGEPELVCEASNWWKAARQMKGTDNQNRVHNLDEAVLGQYEEFPDTSDGLVARLKAMF